MDIVEFFQTVYMTTKIIYATAFRTETTSSIRKTAWIL